MGKLNLLLLLSFMSACSSPSQRVVVSVDAVYEEVQYGMDHLTGALIDQGYELKDASDNVRESDLRLEIILQTATDDTDGYELANNKGHLVLKSNTERGVIYGLMALAEKLADGVRWQDIPSETIEAHYDFRAIKFNLPWFSYRSGENLALHQETCRDLVFWEAFLDMMVRNKFNALTLWNLHPFIYMVKPANFPEASPFTDEEMQSWQQFWKALFKMARQRGIETYVVNWNIFVSEEFAQAHGIASYSNASGFWGDGESNELIEKYTREIVTQTINEYDDLTGIGITLGERMGGMTAQQRKDWIDRTIVAGVKEAKREARLIYRAPLSAGTTSHGTTSVSTEKLTRQALETIGLKEEVLVEFKFNWSHAHSSPKVSIVHGGILTDTYWNPEPSNYKGVWTMRNEDFFVLRWAQPDFIRAFMHNNSQTYIAGCIIGSETYIPAKDYITREEFRKWDYAFQRQWLFYETWGNLLFNAETTDSQLASAINRRLNISHGGELLTAWKLASTNANTFASFHQGTWDATIYTEGFTTVGGKFIGIEKFISQPVLDSSLVNIVDFVAGNFEKDQVTPPELALKLETDNAEALKIVDMLTQEYPDNEWLIIELQDIVSWSHYGNYLAKKIRGGLALQQFMTSGQEKFQNEAVQHLKAAQRSWHLLVESVEKYNNEVIPYQFDQEFSWRKHNDDVQDDITYTQQLKSINPNLEL